MSGPGGAGNRPTGRAVAWSKLEAALLANIGEGVVAVAEDGRIVYFNRVAQQLLGLSPEVSLGQHFIAAWTMLDEKERTLPLEERPLQRVLTAGGRVTASGYYVSRGGAFEVPVTVTASPIILEGQTVGAVVVFRDTTRESAVDRAKSEFVSLASHQMRSPLSAISWYTEMLLAGDAGKLTAKQRRYLEEVYGGSRRMALLVNDLLNVSRLELGTFTVEPEPVRLSNLVRTIVSELKPLIVRKRLRVQTTYDRRVPVIAADPTLLRIVLQNLLSNAVKYTPPQGTVRLRTSRQGSRELLVVVTDTGYGIPKDQQEKIFTKLFRAENVVLRVPEGSGLGLYIAKAVLDRVGGRIEFESIEGRGTTFSVTLPLQGMAEKKGTTTLAVS